MIYPFVENPIPKEQLMQMKQFKAYQIVSSKPYHRFTPEEKEFVGTYFNALWYPETYETGRLKVLGWVIDFSPYMKTYLVNYKYYGWKEVKAFNKTWVRNKYTTPSQVLEIVKKEE